MKGADYIEADVLPDEELVQEVQQENGKSAVQQNRPGYKHTAVGWIPEEWEVCTLGEICDNFKSGVGITANEINDEAEFAVYGGNGLRGYTTTYTHEGNYILIGRQGALCGNITLVHGRNYISEHAIAVSTNRKSSFRWLSYYLDYFNLNRLSESSAQPGLAVNKLIKLKIPLPPFPEQQAIATLLSTWDKAIDKATQLITQKELRKKWLMQQLLTGKRRLPGFEGEWREVRLGEIGKFSKGSGISKAEVQEDGLPCIRYGEIYTTHHIRIQKFFSYINDDSAKLSKRILKGDILFAGSGETTEDIGKCVSFLEEIEAYAGGDIIIFRSENLDSLFLSYLLNSDGVNKQKSAMGKGHSVVHIYPKDLAEIIIQLPTVEEQAAIAAILQTADKELQLLQIKQEQLKVQKKGLMQVLLTGSKRLKIQHLN